MVVHRLGMGQLLDVMMRANIKQRKNIFHFIAAVRWVDLVE